MEQKPPKDKVTPISRHPNFNSQEQPMDISEVMEGMGEELDGYIAEESLQITDVLTKYPVVSVCNYCVHAKKVRSGFLGRKSSFMDWQCRATYRAKTTHPQTGEVSYLPLGAYTLFQAKEEPLEYCFSVNPSGRCKKYDSRRRSRSFFSKLRKFFLGR